MPRGQQQRTCQYSGRPCLAALINHDPLVAVVLDDDMAVRLSVQFRDKSVSLPGDRDDVMVFTTDVAKCLSKRRDVDGEIVLFNELVLPDAVKKIVLREDRSRILD